MTFPHSFSSDPLIPSLPPCFKTVSPLKKHYMIWSIFAVALNITSLIAIISQKNGLAFLMCSTSLGIIALVFSWPDPLFKLTALITLPYKIIHFIIKSLFILLAFLFWCCYAHTGAYSHKKEVIILKPEDITSKDPYYSYNFQISFCKALSFISEKQNWFIILTIALIFLSIIFMVILPETTY